MVKNCLTLSSADPIYPVPTYMANSSLYQDRKSQEFEDRASLLACLTASRSFLFHDNFHPLNYTPLIKGVNLHPFN